MDIINNSNQKDLHSMIIDYLKEKISTITELSLVDIDNDTSFEDFGIDSVMMIELHKLISKDFQDLRPTILFDYNTINILNKFLVDNYSNLIKEKLISTEQYKNTTNNVNDSNNIKELKEDSITTTDDGEKSIQNIQSSSLDSQPIVEFGVNSSEVQSANEQNQIKNTQSMKKDEKKDTKVVKVIEGRRIIKKIQKNAPISIPEELDTYWNSREKQLPEIKENESVRDYLANILSNNERHRLFVELESKKIMEVIIAGTGRPIVLLPNFGITAPVWSYQFKEWASKYQLIVFHTPGTGNSDLVEDVSIENQAKILLEVLNKLKINYPFHLISTSFNGMIAQQYARKNLNKIASLIFSSSFCEINFEYFTGGTRTDIYQRDFDHVIKMTNDKRIKKIRDKCMDLLLDATIVDPKMGILNNSLIENGISNIGFLGKLTIPTLIIQGKFDGVHQQGKLMNFLIPSSKYIEYKTAGHFPHLTHSKKFNRNVLRFIKNVEKKISKNK